MNREYVRFVASVGLIAVGLVVALLILSGGAIADQDLVLETDDITFTVDGQEDNSPTEGDIVTIVAKVHNLGSDNVTDNFDVRFSDGVALDTTVAVTDNVTSDDGILNVSTTWTSTGPGIHTITVEVDYANPGSITESNETNNTASKNLDVNIAPDVTLNVDPMTELTLNNINFNSTGSSDPDGNIVSFFWAFGDGTFSNKDPTTHAYSDDGVYTVTLLITDNDGGTNSTTTQVTINNRPPEAKGTDQSGLTYDTIWFDSANSSDADGSVTNISWYFVDFGIYKYGKKVTYTFTDDGVYSVDMTVTDDDNATDLKTFYATISNRAPSVNIWANRTRINSTENITFQGGASSDMDGSVVNYTWIFPNAVNRYGPTVSYQFNLANGSYLVTLVITDDDGAIAFKSINIKVGNKLPISSPGLDTIADTYSMILYDGSASYDPDGSIVNYTWDMGNGVKRYNNTFNYFYTDDGTYIVRLTVIDDEGASATNTLTTTILNQAPAAYHKPVTIQTFTQYLFNTTDSVDVDGYIASVTWVFQDDRSGTQFTTVNGNTTYQWSENGTYLVEMTVTDDDGASDVFTFNVTIMNSNPWAIFTYSPITAISVGDEVTFDASQSIDLDGTIANWIWFFGESPTSMGSGEVSTYTYTLSGLFTVELQVTDNNGGSNSTQKTIFVAAQNDPPVPSFTVSGAEMMTNRSINFDGTESFDPDGEIVKYSWDLGDGKGISFGQTLNYKYYYPGTYTVIFTVEDNGGKTNSTSQDVTVTQAPNLLPICVMEGGGIDIVAGDKIILDGRGSYDPDGYLVNFTWDFGDGTYKYASYVQKSYKSTDVGTKTVRLTVRDNMGGSDSCQSSITVLTPPKKNIAPSAQFSFSPPEPVATGQEIKFDASSSTDSDGTIIGYTWLFGDGTFAEGKSVIHSYSDNTVYLVVLTVLDNSDGTGTISKEISISNRGPTAVITADKTSAMTLDAIKFSASKSKDEDGVIRSYTWVFGDEKVTKTGKDVTHSFKDWGNQKVTLKVLDNDGATGTVEMTIKIDNRPPVAKVGGDVPVLEETIIELDGSGSKDMDGYIQEYIWDLGDQRSERGPKPMVSWPKLPEGTDQQVFQASLTVVDDAGSTSEKVYFNVTVLKKQENKPRPPSTSGFIPGFDAVLFLAAVSIAVTVVMVNRKRR